MLTYIGSRTTAIIQSSGNFTLLVTETLRAMFRRPFEVRELLHQLEIVGVKSLSVVIVTALFTGMVFTLQTFDGFARFQAEAYVPGVLGLALTRELIPVLSALMVAGRVGSAMAAELGTMKVTEQIAALNAMAVDPIQYLVVPRFLAGLLMMPLLFAVGNLIGLLGGWSLLEFVLNTPTPAFLDRVFEMLDFEDFLSGFTKSAVFGAIISSVGCYHGLHTSKGAAGVGLSTTNAVVNASLAILIADFFITKAFF